jgi:dTDP-4-dehydrorhamnose reductase
MRTLVFGGTGMLGRAVVSQGRRQGWPVLGLSRSQADITDRERLGYWVEAFRPEVIINCAAFTEVDACEKETEKAFAVNGHAVANVVAAAARFRARLLQVSTDYVFDGRATAPYAEDAAPAPLSVYGASKLEGERQALGYEGALVVRTSWLFGPGSKNFVVTILDLVDRGKVPLRVVDDQIGCPTYAPHLARALLELSEQELTGIVHYRNREPVSWYGFATEISRLANGGVEAVAVSSQEFPRPASRPAYSVLEVGRFEAIVGHSVEPWGEGLEEYLSQLRQGVHE